MRRLLFAGVGVLAGAVMLSTSASAQSMPRTPRAEAGVSMLMSPSANSRIPELMVGPMLNITVAQAGGGIVGVEGAMRFRADGTQLQVCPQPPGVICDARNVKTLTTAGLTFRRGFGAQPMREGAIFRAGLGAAFTSLKGAATVFPNADGSQPALEDVQKNSGVADLGLGWIQRVGTVPVRLEGRVAGFAPELANTRFVYGLQIGFGY